MRLVACLAIDASCHPERKRRISAPQARADWRRSFWALAPNRLAAALWRSFDSALRAPLRIDDSFDLTKWFYERARGSYRDAQAYLTPAAKRKFAKEYPKAQSFTIPPDGSCCAAERFSLLELVIRSEPEMCL